MRESAYDKDYQITKVKEFKSVGYGKKMAWLEKQPFSQSLLYAWIKKYSMAGKRLKKTGPRRGKRKVA